MPTKSIPYWCHQVCSYCIHWCWKQIVLVADWTSVCISDLTWTIIVSWYCLTRYELLVTLHTLRGWNSYTWLQSLTLLQLGPHLLHQLCSAFALVLLLLFICWPVALGVFAYREGECAGLPYMEWLHPGLISLSKMMPNPLTQVSTPSLPFHHPESSSCIEADGSWKET